MNLAAIIVLRRSAFFGVLAITACSGSDEAKRVELAVVTDGARLEPVTTDLGYTVELNTAELVVVDLKFTIVGEAHTSVWRRLSDAVVPVAHAHPGHYQGGEVTGELLGHFVLRFSTGGTHELGKAALLTGKYHSMNLTLARATIAEVEEDDPLLGHTAVFNGEVSKDDVQIGFQIRVDSPEAREIVGIPFQSDVTRDTEQVLALRLLTRDPLEEDTLFDGIDFGLLDGDGDGQAQVTPDATDADTVAAYNQFRRTLQTHDHFVVEREPISP
jgi:hypothetical protein